MAFLQIRSTNPDFSFLIKKNPASGMLIKPIRLGHGFGWFTDLQTYNCFFRDADNESSYSEEPFEYVDSTRYNSIQFVLNALSEFFHSIIMQADEKDIEGFEHKVFLNLVLIKPKYINIFNRYFSDFVIDSTHVVANNYQLTFSTKRPLRALLNFVNLFAVFNVLKSEYRLDVNEDIIEKYLRCLKVINAPYFIKYTFKVNLLSNSFFSKYKDQLCTEDCQLVYGSTVVQRLTTVTSRLTNNNHIVDIGCGYGAFVFSLAKNLKEDLHYYAIDIDEDVRERITHKAKMQQLGNVFVLDSFDSFLSGVKPELPGYDILLVEVLEHMTLEEAEVLVKKVLKFPFLKSVLITTPNKDFNKCYFETEDEMRHEDHKFEFTEEEFKRWLSDLTKDFQCKFLNIGDVVQGRPTTLGAWIQKG